MTRKYPPDLPRDLLSFNRQFPYYSVTLTAQSEPYGVHLERERYPYRSPEVGGYFYEVDEGARRRLFNSCTVTMLDDGRKWFMLTVELSRS